MKIQIEDSKGVSITATGLSDYLSRKEISEISGGIVDMIKMVHGYENASDKQVTVPSSKEDTNVAVKAMQKVIHEQYPTAIQPADTPLIRPRIPNNVVDINDLTIEKAVTENALVRCPYCGQAHCLVVPSNNGVYLMRRDFNDNEFGIIAEFDTLEARDFVNMCCKPETNRKAYYEDLQTMNFFYNTDFAVDNNTEIFCPVCCHSNTFSSWKDAFEHPLNYFETEQLCDACGGEKIDRFIKKKHIYQCDKCGLQTEFKEE